MVSRAVRSIGLTFNIIFFASFLTFSLSFIFFLGGGGDIENDGGGMVFGVGLAGQAAWLPG